VCDRVICTILPEISLFTGEQFYVQRMSRYNLTQEIHDINDCAVDDRP